MENNGLKNLLAIIGGAAIVVAAPTLSAGIAIGVAYSNRDKISAAMKEALVQPPADNEDMEDEEESEYGTLASDEL